MQSIKKYLITSQNFYTDKADIFCKILQKQLLKHKPDYILFRDKTNNNYDSLAKEFVKECSKINALKYFIHRDVNLAFELKASGVHLTSDSFADIKKAKELGLLVIISTHTQKEVLKAQRLGSDYVTYSPIFDTPNKGEPKGVENLKEVVLNSSINIFALGGIIDEKQIREVSKADTYGFASIRYFEL